jgi:hypothetical protein
MELEIVLYCILYIVGIERNRNNMSHEPFDDIFLQVAGRAGGIQPLLDSFFGFLSRKTDFYVQYDPNVRARMGFAPGAAERMVSDFLVL